jgi:hypothetical protein
MIKTCFSVFTGCVKGNSVNVKRVWYPCNISRTFIKTKQADTGSLKRTEAEGNRQQTAGTWQL